MSELLTEKVRLGVSACIDSCPVRYNGKQFDALAVLGRERGDFVVTPVCPECMAGFGVPREPVHLTGSGAAVLAGEARVRDRHGRDVSERLIAGASACLDAFDRAGVEAVIVKESSPSCGVYHAKVGRARKQSVEGSGVFGAMLLSHDWFIIPDTALASPLRWWDARRRLHAWLWLRRREVTSAHQLQETWHVLKFLVQELDRPLADDLGRQLAAMKGFDPEFAERLRAAVLEKLRQPSSPQRIRAAMWKAYARLRSRGEDEGVCVDPPDRPRGSTAIAEELLQLEKVSYMHDSLFGPSPVIARSGPYRPRAPRAGNH